MIKRFCVKCSQIRESSEIHFDSGTHFCKTCGLELLYLNLNIPEHLQVFGAVS